MSEYTFHQSQLGQFDLCPERGRALYAGEVQDRYNDSALYGTVVHSGIELFLNAKLRREPTPTLHDMVRHFGVELRREMDENEVKWIKFTPEKLVEMAAQAYAGWLREIEPAVAPKHVEYKFDRVPLFATPLGDYEHDLTEVYLAGQMDCIDAYGTLWDWKTSSRPYTPWEKQRWAIQPTVYAYAWHWITGKSWPIEFQYAVLLHSGEVQRLVVTRTAEHVEWLRHKLLALVRVLESGQAPLPLNDSGWWCSDVWCPNWENCKGAHHGGDDWRKVRKIEGS